MLVCEAESTSVAVPGLVHALGGYIFSFVQIGLFRQSLLLMEALRNHEFPLLEYVPSVLGLKTIHGFEIKKRSGTQRRSILS